MEMSVCGDVFMFCSIMNSLVIVLFLSGMVAMIMLRTLHRDIARYNQMDNSVSLPPPPARPYRHSSSQQLLSRAVCTQFCRISVQCRADMVGVVVGCLCL